MTNLNFGIPLTLIGGYQHLTEEEVNSLRSQGVCLDDWDYMLICSNDILIESQREEDDYETGGTKIVTRYEPKDNSLQGLLVGCCSNTWYKVSFRGKNLAIGVAYHG